MEIVALIPDGPSYSALANAVAEAAVGVGDENKPYEEHVEKQNQVQSQTIDAIRAADVVVADVSINVSNVFFELGVAYALGRPIVLLLSTDAGNRLPLDLAALLVITYDPNNMVALTERLTRYFVHIRSTRSELGA